MWKSTRMPTNPPPGAYDGARSSSEGRSSHPIGMPYPHSFVPKADKYRTVPCKYYHRYSYYKVVHKAAAKYKTAPSFTTTATRAKQSPQV